MIKTPDAAGHVSVEKLAPATYTDVQDFANFFGNRTLLSGGTISDSGSGEIDVAACTAWCKESDSDIAIGRFFNFAGKTNISLTNLSVNAIYLDYNDGTPQVVVAASYATYGFKQDHILMGAVFRQGTALHILQSDLLGIQSINRVFMHQVEHYGGHRENGLVTTDGGSLALSITTGIIMAGLTRVVTDIDGSTWSYWYTSDSGSTWAEDTGVSAIAQYYNNIASGKVALGTGKYGIHWVYVDFEGDHCHIVYGQGNYNANQAEEAKVPSVLPPIVTGYCVLIAKIINQKGSNDMVITYPWTTVFTSSMATDHGSLAGLSDDDHSIYHTDARHDARNVNTHADITSTGANIEDAVTKKHTQGTDQKLDDGGANEVTAPDAKDAVEKKHTQLCEATDFSKLDLIEAEADVTDATNVNGAGAVMESDFDATSFLYALANNTPLPKTPAETMAILSGEAAADFAMNTHKITGVVDPTADQDAATKNYVDDSIDDAKAVVGLDFANRAKITIDHDTIDEDLTNFPVMILLSVASGAFATFLAAANDKKIAVTTSDGVTQCYVEIDTWDDVGEEAWIHVKVPSISSSEDTILYFYHDSSHADNDTYIGDTGDATAQAVWAANFKTTHHMNDDPDTSHIVDSTDNGNDGTKEGADEPIEAAGLVGKAQDFDGTNDDINCGNVDSNVGVGDFTLEMLVKQGAYTSFRRLLYKRAWVGWYQGYGIYTYSTGLNYTITDAGNVTKKFYSPSISDGTDHYIACTFDRDGNGIGYTDGVAGTPVDISGAALTLDNVGNLYIGSYNGVAHWFDGLIGEVRISSVARSAAWIKATNATLRDELLAFGSIETRCCGLFA